MVQSNLKHDESPLMIWNKNSPEMQWRFTQIGYRKMEEDG